MGLQDERTQRQISKWLRSLIKVQPNFGACIGSLNAFFTEHAKLKAPVRPALPAANKAPRQQNAFLQVCAHPSMSRKASQGFVSAMLGFQFLKRRCMHG